MSVAERTDADVTQSHPKKYFKVLGNDTKCMQNGFSIMGHGLTTNINKPLFQQLSHPRSCVLNLRGNVMVKDRHERQRRWSTHLGQNLEMLRRPCAAWSSEMSMGDPTQQTNHGTCFQTKNVTLNTNLTRLDSLSNFGFVWHSRQIVVYGFQPHFSVQNLWHWCLVL